MSASSSASFSFRQLRQWASSRDLSDRLRAAEHPRAPAAVLRRLADDEVPEIQQAVARHPNTPLAVVLRLAADYPKAVLENPARSMWAVEQPGFLSEVAPDALKALLQQEQAPKAWLRWAAQQKGVFTMTRRRIVASNPTTPADVLHTLSQETGMRMEVAANPSAPPEVLMGLARTHNWKVRRRVALHSSTPSSAVARLATDSSEEVRKGAASRPEVPKAALRALVVDAHSAVRHVARYNPKCPEAIVELLVKAGSTDDLTERRKGAADLTDGERQRLIEAGPWGRELAARHTETPASVLRSLADAETPGVRQAVAEHPETPPETLRSLAEDETLRVRKAVAENERTQPSALRILAVDKEWRVRGAVARHADTPVDILKDLKHDNLIVRRTVARHPRMADHSEGRCDAESTTIRTV